MYGLARRVGAALKYASRDAWIDNVDLFRCNADQPDGIQLRALRNRNQAVRMTQNLIDVTAVGCDVCCCVKLRHELAGHVENRSSKPGALQAIADDVGDVENVRRHERQIQRRN